MRALERRDPPGPVLRVELAGDHSDTELVLRARSGERWAHEAIFRRYVREVAFLVERLLRRRQDADDVIQDTFAAALTSMNALRDPSTLRSWLLGIAVNRVRRRDRRAGWLRALGLDRGIDDATFELLATPELSPEARSELSLLERAVWSLPREERTAWILRRVQGEKLEDIATIVGCSLATVKRRLARAEEHVRDHTAGDEE